MEYWLITDDRVIQAIQQNGFICQKHQTVLMPGAVHFITKSKEEEEASRWYDTDCPVEMNKSYTLPDGNVIRSKGTQLVLEKGR